MVFFIYNASILLVTTLLLFALGTMFCLEPLLMYVAGFVKFFINSFLNHNSVSLFRMLLQVAI